jgi:hypothetical protein
MSVHSFDLPRRVVDETLKLRIVYREFRKGKWRIADLEYNSDTSALPEVETLIERSADKALEDFPALANRRSSLIRSMVKALEMDSKWIPLYNITGQLEAPPVPDLEPELEPVVSKTKKVPS